MTPEERIKLREQSYQFAEDNMKECVQDILEWHKTSILKEGKARELHQKCMEWSESPSLSIMTNIVTEVAFKHIVESKKEKMLISLIVAVSQNGVIGLNDEIPWNVPEDMAHFKRTTLLKPIIMGNTTFKSIGILPNRFNIVLSRTPQKSSSSSVIYVDNIQTAIEKASEYCNLHNLNECVVIGGENIYNQTIDIVDKIYYTEIHKEVKGDTFFSFNKKDWIELYDERVTGVSRNKEGTTYTISTFMRKK